MTTKERVRAHIEGKIDTDTLTTSIGSCGYDAYRQEVKDAEDVQAKLMDLLMRIKDDPDGLTFGDFDAEIATAMNGRELPCQHPLSRLHIHVSGGRIEIDCIKCGRVS